MDLDPEPFRHDFCIFFDLWGRQNTSIREVAKCKCGSSVTTVLDIQDVRIWDVTAWTDAGQVKHISLFQL